MERSHFADPLRAHPGNCDADAGEYQSRVRSSAVASACPASPWREPRESHQWSRDPDSARRRDRSPRLAGHLAGSQMAHHQGDPGRPGDRARLPAGGDAAIRGQGDGAGGAGAELARLEPRDPAKQPFEPRGGRRQGDPHRAVGGGRGGPQPASLYRYQSLSRAADRRSGRPVARPDGGQRGQRAVVRPQRLWLGRRAPGHAAVERAGPVAGRGHDADCRPGRQLCADRGQRRSVVAGDAVAAGARGARVERVGRDHAGEEHARQPRHALPRGAQ